MIVKIGLEIGGLLIFTYLLIKGTELVIKGVLELAKVTKVGKFGIATLVLALATSFPELFVGITAGLDKRSEISLGNVLGSNIANVSLIMGVAALLGGSVPVVGEFIHFDFWAALLTGALPLLLMADGQIGRGDGVVLLAVYGYYLFSVLHKKHVKAMTADKAHLRVRFLRRLVVWTEEEHRKVLGLIVLGLGLLLLSAEMVVRLAAMLAAELNAPVFLISLFLVAVGTSLPELAVEIQAVKKREVALVFGNLLGSNVANATLILGLTAILSPIGILSRESYIMAIGSYGVVFTLFWLLAHSKHRLDRAEGGVLVAIYILFVVGELVLTPLLRK